MMISVLVGVTRTSTPTLLPTPTEPSSLLMSPPLLLPVPTTSPPREASTKGRLERTHVSHFGIYSLDCVNFAQTRNSVPSYLI